MPVAMMPSFLGERILKPGKTISQKPLDPALDFLRPPLCLVERPAFCHAGPFVADGRQPGILEQPLPLPDELEHVEPVRHGRQDRLAIDRLGGRRNAPVGQQRRAMSQWPMSLGWTPSPDSR